VESVNQKDAQKLLEVNGWTRTIGGKHAVKMEKPERRSITLLHHEGRDYSPGLWASILRQAGLR
jgi:predicted RNA binding protein YcfA (HicA-like mRNA interferase family)